jgi:HAE1 family hydrophobic/amphiphilic exporter-1
MNLAKMAIKRPTFIVALLTVVLILGVISLRKLSVTKYPDVEIPVVSIMTTYSGAGVAEIEQLVTKPIEDAVSGISGLKHIQSVNQDNMSLISSEFELSKDPDIAAQEVRDKIGPLRRDLPDGIGEPVVMKLDINSRPLVSLSLKSKSMTPRQLCDFADDVVTKDFEQISGVSKVKIVGGSKREIHIKVDRKKLKEHGLTLTSLATRIKANSSNTPAGSIDRGSQEVSFRTIGEFKSVEQINNVVVSFLGNDKPITVRDVAKVEDGVAAETSRARLDIKKDGEIVYEQSLLIQIYKQAKGNDIAVSDGIKKKINEVNEKYKQVVGTPNITVISDEAHGVRMNVEDVESTILEGVFLAIVVVYFFLGSWRSTFITALSLPNSLIGSFVFMYAFGFSLNVLSLMSLSLAVGLLIDDAIVVRENIFRHYEGGASPVKAAIDGTNEVTLAVVATTSTVIAVFLPIAFLDGVVGQFFKEFGLTVVFAMVISIADALTIAPMLSAYIIPEHNKKVSKKWKIQEYIVKVVRALTVDWFDKVFMFVEQSYKKMISFIVKEKLVDVETSVFGKKKRRFVISWKFITLLVALLVFVGTIAIAKKYLKTSFMPPSEWGEFSLSVKAKPGTSLEQMDKYMLQVEEIIMKDPDIEFVSSSVGSGSGNMSTASLASESSIYVKMIAAKHGLFTKNKRTRTTSEMKDYLREVLNEKFGDELELSVVNQSLGGGNSEFAMELSGDNMKVLYDAAKQLMEKCKTIPNFVDIHSNYQPGKPEVQIQMDPKNMENFGVSSCVVGNEIRAMINGTKAGKYRENGLEYDILVKFQDNQQDIAKNFDTIYVDNINNKLVKLKNVAYVKNTSSPVQIFRKDGSLFVSVEGNLSSGGTIGEVQNQALKIFNEMKSDPENLEKWKNIKCAFSRNAEDMNNMLKSIAIAGALSIVFIFVVLASLYESVITPFTIMTALPLAIIGGIIALLVANQSADMFTLIGMIMLLGIVAKNSILLVDYIQQQMRDSGLSMDDSIIKAGTVRLRPILMTSFALIAGMLPTALGLSEVGQFRKGMGIVVIGGVISSTILTLIVVPSVFEYMDKIRLFLRRITGRPEKRMVDYTDEQLRKEGL